jgi:hypothetical protein
VRIEAALAPAPVGGRWRATNPPRCLKCHQAVGRSIAEGDVYYLVYKDSLLLDEPPGSNGFREALDPKFSAA